MGKLWIEETEYAQLQMNASTLSMLLAAVVKRYGEEDGEQFGIVLSQVEMNEVEGWGLMFGTRPQIVTNGDAPSTEYWVTATDDPALINFFTSEDEPDE